VEYTLAELQRRKVPIRIVRAGDLLTAGAITLEVLHPPGSGPEGNENTRSLVLRVEHAGRTILLTGDLEGAGLQRVLATPTIPIDILMAPHHGSHRIDAEGLIAWARPRVVISCQGRPRSVRAPPPIYRQGGRYFFSTWECGAVTVRSHSSGLVIETFLDRQLLAMPTRKDEVNQRR
jgi:competence protein ComEC